MEGSHPSSLEQGKQEREQKRLASIERFQKLQFIKGNPQKLTKILEILEFKNKPISKKDLELVLLEPSRKYQNELKTSELLGFSSSNDQKYEITSKGKEFLSASPEKQREILSWALLENNLYRDLLFNMRISKDRTMPEAQVGQNFYELFAAINEKDRNSVVHGLIDFALFAEIVDRIKDKDTTRLRLLQKGENIYDQIVQRKPKKSRKSPQMKKTIDYETIQRLSIACYNCEREIQKDYTYCPYCAKQVKIKCNKCQKTLVADWKLCPYCATPR